MDGEDDDFYSPNGAGDEHRQDDMDHSHDFKYDDRGDELEEGEEEEDSDSDSVEIIVDDNALAHSQPRFPSAAKPEPVVQLAPPEQAPKKEQTTPSKATSTAPTIQLRNGADYPEVHTSTVDITADPVYPGAGKPVTQIDIDADLAEHTKPWRLPGADQSDYFNYGFDEFTWASYVLRQQTMAATLREQKDQTAQFQQMFGSIPGMPGMPASTGSIPTGPAAAQQNNAASPMGGMGMGSPEEMMTAMYQYMASQGISDPNQVDFNQFMQQFGGQMGMQPPAGPPTGPAAQQAAQGQAAYGGFGNYGGGQGGQGGGGGYGGRGGRGGRRW